MARSRVLSCVLLLSALTPPLALAESPLITFNDDGGWCWFEDERAIVHDGKLILGTIASGSHDIARRGNVEVVTYDLATGALHRSVLRERFQYDDHDSPALLVLGDGRILAMYCKHGGENLIYYRVTARPGDTTAWEEEQTFVPSPSSHVTYSNLFRLTEENEGRGRLYNFFRGYDATFKPSWMTSDDEGQSWTARGVWIHFESPVKHRPYVKYASDGRGTIHFIFTEAHPRDYDNSIYHAYYSNHAFYRSNGEKIKAVDDGPVTPEEATRVFAGDAQNVAWTSDLHLDGAGRPVMVFSVQKDSGGLKSGHPQAGHDLRYHYARWDGAKWQSAQVAYAGSRLYVGEDDYTGNICIDPYRTNVVYLSSNVDVATGRPNASGHYEVHRAVLDPSGKNPAFECLTPNATEDHLRPIVPWGRSDTSFVLWLRGKYHAFTNYDLDVVGMAWPASTR